MYKLSKIFFALFMINYIWFNRVYGSPRWLKYVLIAGFTISSYLSSSDYSINKVIVRINGYAKYWMMFIVYVLLTGLFVAKNFTSVLNQALFLIQIIFIWYYVSYVGEKENSLVFFYQVFMIVGALYTFTLLKNGIVRTSANRLYLREGSNPNSDAIVLAYGLYSALRLVNYKKLSNIILFYSLSVIEFYGIFLTGSRKAFIIAAIFFVFSFIRMLSIRDELSIRSKAFIFGILLLVTFVGVIRFLPIYLQSSFYQRMQKADVGLQDRWNIAEGAFQVFINHPFFGVGLNNYALYSSSNFYSHSTIPELLAGTGIFGTVLFIIPYIKVLITSSKRGISLIDRGDIRRLFIGIWAIGLVMIIPYGMPLCFFSILLFVEMEIAQFRAIDKRND